MKFIDRQLIEEWSKTTDSKTSFPELISRLVAATTSPGTTYNFPAGIAVFEGGYDGKIESLHPTRFVAEGISLWELGTEQNVKKKADEDYTKRSLNPLDYDTRKVTFVFATARYWQKKEIWRKERLKEGIWKNIVVIDAEYLEAWILQAPAVARWFSAITKSYPYDGILTPEIFWTEWSEGPKGILPARSVTAGRENQAEQILSFLRGPAGIKAIKASTKTEAIAFIIAAAKQFDDKTSEYFFSKALIVETEENFRGLSINKSSLILIAKTNDAQILYKGKTDGHHILVPLAANDEIDRDEIQLPIVDRNGLLESLMEMGLDETSASNLIKESGRDMTILKKLLGHPSNKIQWTLPEHARDIIPALLIQRWDETKNGDKELIEYLSKKTYEQYMIQIARWVKSEISPAFQMGHLWRLTAPLDSWADLAPALLKSDLDDLARMFRLVFIQTQDNFEIPSYPEFSVIKTTYSSWLREGLLQSLILIGYHGSKLRIPTVKDPQTWVDQLISELLDNASPAQWRQLIRELPLLAEASPVGFLSAVEQSLIRENGIVEGLFTTKNTYSDKHATLLWALEALCWISEHFYKSVDILGALAALKFNIQIVNSPINSLREVFNSWFSQTLANVSEQLRSLEMIKNKHTGVAWELFSSLLKDNLGNAHFTHRMRWRMFEMPAEAEYDQQRQVLIREFAAEKLIALFDGSQNKYIQLIDLSVRLKPNSKHLILEFLAKKSAEINDTDQKILTTLRALIGEHRTYAQYDWALSEKELTAYENLYHLLAPGTSVENAYWLFNSPRTFLLEGFAGQTDGTVNDIILTKQIQTLSALVAEHGFKILTQMAGQVRHPNYLGTAAAYLELSQAEQYQLCILLNQNESLDAFIAGFICRKVILDGTPWIVSIYDKMNQDITLKPVLAKLFTDLVQTDDVFNLIETLEQEVQRQYWESVNLSYIALSDPYLIKEIQKLITYNRFEPAAHMILEITPQVSSALICELMDAMRTGKSSDHKVLSSYQVTEIFKELYCRQDIDNNYILDLEWHYMDFFDRYVSQQKPQYTLEKLDSSPEFFVRMLRFNCPFSNDAKNEDQCYDFLNAQILDQRKKAKVLFDHWHTLPGVDENANVSKEILKTWIDQVRALCASEGMLNTADMKLGEMFAVYPERNEIWPPYALSELIQSIHSDSLNNSFITAVLNKRSEKTGSIFTGGGRERGLAKKFENFAALQEDNYPGVAKLLILVASHYLKEADDEDLNAEIQRMEQ